MAVHDFYARRTPYELVFPEGDEASVFDPIAEEAREREVDPTRSETFIMLMATGRALREMMGPDDEPDLIRDHGLLLFHLFRSWRVGNPLVLVRTSTVRHLVDSVPPVGDSVTLAHEAGYLQLPQHLVWVRQAGDAPPESLDGFYWAVEDESLSILGAMGIRSERAGLGVISVSRAPLSEFDQWLQGSGREDGHDFESSLPGAEIDDLYEVQTAGEVLKLAARSLALLGRSGVDDSSAKPAGAGERLPSQAGDGPPRSSLPYVVLGAA